MAFFSFLGYEQLMKKTYQNFTAYRICLKIPYHFQVPWLRKTCPARLNKPGGITEQYMSRLIFLWVTSPPYTSQKWFPGLSAIYFGKCPFLNICPTGIQSLYNIHKYVLIFSNRRQVVLLEASFILCFILCCPERQHSSNVLATYFPKGCPGKGWVTLRVGARDWLPKFKSWFCSYQDKCYCPNTQAGSATSLSSSGSSLVCKKGDDNSRLLRDSWKLMAYYQCWAQSLEYSNCASIRILITSIGKVRAHCF